MIARIAAGAPMVGFSVGRVAAMTLRYWYLLRGSLPRMAELVYWPTVQMITWGFMTLYLRPDGDPLAQGFGVFLSGIMLWDVCFRGQISLCGAFLEEMYARNLGHLMASPLRPVEFAAALLTTSLIRTLIGLVPTSLLALWFFGFSIYSLGLALVAFFVLLIVMGWSVGLIVSGLIMRVGLGAESFAWAAIFALSPISGVFYPIATLPAWLQPVALALPSAHVFEGMRAILDEGRLDLTSMALAAGLDVVFLGLGFAAFLAFHASAKSHGRLMQMGE